MFATQGGRTDGQRPADEHDRLQRSRCYSWGFLKEKNAFKRLLCLTCGSTRSAQGLVGPVLACCDWVRQASLRSSTSMSEWQHVGLCQQIRPWGTLCLGWFVCLFVDCVTSHQRAGVSQGRIFFDNCTCCNAKTEVADHTSHLTQSQFIDTGTSSPSADPTTPGVWQGSRWGAKFQVTGMTQPGKKIPTEKAGLEPWIFRSRCGRLNHFASEAVAWLGHEATEETRKWTMSLLPHCGQKYKPVKGDRWPTRNRHWTTTNATLVTIDSKLINTDPTLYSTLINTDSTLFLTLINTDSTLYSTLISTYSTLYSTLININSTLYSTLISTYSTQ